MNDEMLITNLSLRVLEAMRECPLKKKSIAEFERYGLRPILKYFSTNGWETVSEDRLNEFVYTSRNAVEEHRLSEYQWRHIRRAAVYLQKMAETGMLPDRPLRKWTAEHNVLFQTNPHSSSMDSIEYVVCLAREKALELGLSEKSMMNYTYEGFGYILKYFIGRSIHEYSSKILDEMIVQARAKYLRHEIGRAKFQNIRKAAHWIKEYTSTGQVSLGKLSSYDHPKIISEDFERLITEYVNSSQISGGLKKNSCCAYRWILQRFFREMELHGIFSYNEITLSDVSHCIRVATKKHPKAISSEMNALRSFARFILEYHPELPNIMPALFGTPAKHHHVFTGFSTQEILRILDSIDRSSAKGKRDFAMIMLAYDTGMRSVDIVNLRICDIDLQSHSIRLVQAKTNVPIALPITAKTIAAITDYMKNGRPHSDDDHIFLRLFRPYTALQSNPWRILSKYAIPILGKRPDRQYGFHAIRRGLGQRMLLAQVDPSVICDVLGHTTNHSILQYTAASIDGLRFCAGSLEHIAVEQEELL